MKKEEALNHIKMNLNKEEKLAGYFYAQKPFNIWLFLLIGPLALFSMKYYFIGVSNKGMHFHRLGMLGKFVEHDFFEFKEISNVKIGKGYLQRPMKFSFKNGRKLKIRAQLKGVEKVAKLTEDTQYEIEKNIPTV